jgi:hypothetical protein
MKEWAKSLAGNEKKQRKSEEIKESKGNKF